MPICKWRNFILIVGVGAIMTACSTGVSAYEPTPTMDPSQTPTRIRTPTPRATRTPFPTPTRTLTPAPVGVSVFTDAYEITVVKVRKLETVYLDKESYWIPSPGFMFAELGIKVRSLKSDQDLQLFWDNLFVIEANGHTLTPSWGGSKAVEKGIEIYPPTLVFYPIDENADDITFHDVVFLRLIYAVRDFKPTTLYFQLGDSPLIKVQMP